VKVGDLVKRQAGWIGWKTQQLGVVVFADDVVTQVKWSGDYGTFSHQPTSLEVLSEAR
jgi:hypothetical protein|tara:strand:- start:248 stop:421 length:174 start_codon:yes stop_codon:yes gene_type:complete